MTRPTRVEINCTTGVETIIELTDAEIAQREVDAAAWAVEQAAREAAAVVNAADKAALLTKLGITAEEAKLLLS